LTSCGCGDRTGTPSDVPGRRAAQCHIELLVVLLPHEETEVTSVSSFCCSAASSLRRMNLCIFPVAVLGSSATKSTRRGYLCGASVVFTCCCSSSASASEGSRPCWSTTKACGLTSPSASSWPTTAASSTAGCAISAASTSTGETHWPLTLSMSSERPAYQ